MQYLSEDQVNQMMGVGYLGEVRQGPDGNLYQYVQGVDGLGNPIGGFWRKIKRLARKAVRRALPYVQQFAPLTPGGAALTAVTPILKEEGIEGYDGLGALYQSPDGTLYQQVQGLADDAELHGLSEEEATQMMGIGYIGEVRQGPDGNLYQYVQGIDGLGNPIGAWWKRLIRRALPFAQRLAPFVPGGAAALTAATPFLKQAGVAGYEGLDEDEELRGLAEDEELRGLDEDDELRGIDEDEELRGLSEEEELRGLDEGEELRGLDADEELQGLAEDEDLRGIGEDRDMQGVDGYVRRDGMNGLEAFVPQEPPQMRWQVASALPSEVWKPLW